MLWTTYNRLRHLQTYFSPERPVLSCRVGSLKKLLLVLLSQDQIHCRALTSTEWENQYWHVAITVNDLQMSSFRLNWSRGQPLAFKHTHNLNAFFESTIYIQVYRICQSVGEHSQDSQISLSLNYIYMLAHWYLISLSDKVPSMYRSETQLTARIKTSLRAFIYRNVRDVTEQVTRDNKSSWHPMGMFVHNYITW